MDFQQKLETLHQEIISALCSISELLEGWLPHYVHVEEETEESPDSGHTYYYIYSLTAIYADGTCLLENPGTGKEEKRELKEICIDSLAELWNTCRYLSGEVVDTRIPRLLQSMGKIAKSLITNQFITDFTIHDTVFIHRTNAKIPFIWLVRDAGTHLYQTDEIKEIQALKSILDYYMKYSSSEFCLFKYDGQKLFPVFPKVIREWLEKQLTINHLQSWTKKLDF
jgi:hypothetical protein